MDLAQLHVFLTVARERSFSRAAEKLYRTQPAVSIAIRKLEETIGQPLFLRGARHAKLTDAGELLSEYAERLLNLRDEIGKGMEDLSGLRRGRLSLGVNESSIHALLPALARYRRLYPEVDIAVHRTFSRDIPREVLNYRLDLGVVSYMPQEVQLSAVEIFRDELAFVVYPRHRLARRRSVDLAELGRESFIAHIVESPYRRRVIQLFERHQVPLQMRVELPTIESIKRFVQMEMGVAIVPRMCVRWEVDGGALVELKIRQLKLPRHLYLLSRRGTRLSHAAAALVRLLRGVPAQG
ncbi:MAG: LysR substrate-binding domain-containing protein [Candidatus Acidiferrales bacterium]